MLCPFKFNKARIIKENALCEEHDCAFYSVDKADVITNGRDTRYELGGVLLY